MKVIYVLPYDEVFKHFMSSYHEYHYLKLHPIFTLTIQKDMVGQKMMVVFLVQF